MPAAVDGFVEPGFEAVRDAFETNFAERGEVGASVAVRVAGRPVVDLWGGVADEASARPWTRDTLCLFYSATKGVSAMCVHTLVERGLIDLDEPVATYWPEFAAAGKHTITVRWLLSHRAGLAVIKGDLTLDEALAWDPVVDALAAQEPNWEPGTAHGYHLRSYGWLVGELVRRVDGRTIGRFLRDEIAEPMGLDLWIGLPAELEPRVATLVPPTDGFRELIASLPDEMLLGQATTGPSGHFDYDEMWNTRELHEVELPASNGIGTARALATVYAAVIGEVDGRRLLSPETIATATAEHSSGPDRVLVIDTRFGLGFMLGASIGSGVPDSAFGHPGAGGSLAFADPQAGLTFAYVMNDLRFDLNGDPRSETLVRAAYDALGR